MATANEIITAAQKYLGKPYVWGGESDKEGGFDCSGYVSNVLYDAGVVKTFKRFTAQSLFNASVGSKVTTKKEADIIFFGSGPKNVTHVAIYAGNNKIYESKGGSHNTKSNPGKGVVLSKLTRTDIVGIKRVAKSNTTSTVTYYPASKIATNSFIDALKHIGIDSSFTNRKKIAAANGYPNYTGTASQNGDLRRKCQGGTLIKP